MRFWLKAPNYKRLKMTDEARIANQAAVDYFLESTYGAVCSIDQDGAIKNVNREAARLLGYSRNEMIGRSWTEFVRPDPIDEGETQPYQSPVSTETRNNKKVNGSEVLNRKDGSRIQVDLSHSPLTVNDTRLDTIVHFTATNDTLSTQDDVQKPADFLDKVVQWLPVAAFMLDTNHCVVYWNRACEKLTGISADSIIGTNSHWNSFYKEPHTCVCDFVLNPNIEGFKDLYPVFEPSKLVRGGIHSQNWCSPKNGENRYFLIDCGPVYDQNGKLLGSIEVLRDWTEHKLFEQRLEEDKQQAEIESASKSAFLATMSHEIRTPMNGVLGMTELLRDTKLSKEQNEYVETIHQSGNALTNLINDILDSSKSELDSNNLPNSESNEKLSGILDFKPILLVEDDPINQRVAGAMLNQLNVPFNLANNGIEALEKWKSEQHSLIFMDCSMPEMDGYQATRIIRESEKTERIPIIALTANAMKSDRDRCFKAGMDDFVSKPFKKTTLNEIIEKWALRQYRKVKGSERPGDNPRNNTNGRFETITAQPV